MIHFSFLCYGLKPDDDSAFIYLLFQLLMNLGQDVSRHVDLASLICGMKKLFSKGLFHGGNSV
jgi:hypothetical protein